eukprot:scaffold17945_cov136-Skeletonema_dohrnii-CCMP3373.AAC.1
MQAEEQDLLLHFSHETEVSTAAEYRYVKWPPNQIIHPHPPLKLRTVSIIISSSLQRTIDDEPQQ